MSSTNALRVRPTSSSTPPSMVEKRHDVCEQTTLTMGPVWEKTITTTNTRWDLHERKS